MPITIGSSAQGTVTLQDEDMPEKVPYGGKLGGATETWSDGSLHLQVTGVSLATIDLSGTLRHGDRDSPLAKADRLGAMRDSGALLTLVWSGQTASRRWTGRLLDFVPTIARNEEVDYTLSFFRELTGNLATAAVGATPQDAQSTSTRLGTSSTDGTSAAIKAAQERMYLLGRGG